MIQTEPTQDDEPTQPTVLVVNEGGVLLADKDGILAASKDGIGPVALSDLIELFIEALSYEDEADTKFRNYWRAEISKLPCLKAPYDGAKHDMLVEHEGYPALVCGHCGEPDSYLSLKAYKDGLVPGYHVSNGNPDQSDF